MSMGGLKVHERVNERASSPGWSITVRRYGGLRPWTAFVTEGIMKWSEACFRGRTPEAAARKAMRAIGRSAIAKHQAEIKVRVKIEDDWE